MPAKSNIFRCIAWIVLGLFTLAGCAPATINLNVEGHDRYGSRIFSRNFDDHGRPVFISLYERPTRTGEGFCLVEFEGNRPVISYDIVIKDEPSGNFLKPVTGFFKNLGQALIWGLALGVMFMDAEDSDDPDNTTSASNDDGDAFSAGFVIGTGAGLVYTIYSFGDDTSRLIVNKLETVVSETYYSYDELGRLTSMTSMPPVGNQWKSKSTKFIYHGDETVPSKTDTTGDIDDTEADETL